jgi:hypothetical protein
VIKPEVPVILPILKPSSNRGGIRPFRTPACVIFADLSADPVQEYQSSKTQEYLTSSRPFGRTSEPQFG